MSKIQYIIFSNKLSLQINLNNGEKNYCPKRRNITEQCLNQLKPESWTGRIMSKKNINKLLNRLKK